MCACVVCVSVCARDVCVVCLRSVMNEPLLQARCLYRSREIRGQGRQWSKVSWISPYSCAGLNQQHGFLLVNSVHGVFLLSLRPHTAGSDSEEEGGSLEDELGPNPNRPPPLYVASEDSEESDEEPST